MTEEKTAVERVLEFAKSLGVEPNDISDGYHTFRELYDHRVALFISLLKSHPKISWRANNHDDGTNFDGWFIAGMHLATGDISYHLPADKWTQLDGFGIQTTNRGPKWDGHTAQDVIKRLDIFPKQK